jgi:mannitol-1-phosphate/altronate dehydrogenase
MANGLSSPLLETAIAGWVAYLAKSQSAFGNAWVANDQIMPFVADISRQSSGDIGAFTQLFFGNRAIFGDRLAADEDFIARVGSTARALLADGVAKTLGASMAEASPPG